MILAHLWFLYSILIEEIKMRGEELNKSFKAVHQPGSFCAVFHFVPIIILKSRKIT